MQYREAEAVERLLIDNPRQPWEGLVSGLDFHGESRSSLRSPWQQLLTVLFKQAPSRKRTYVLEQENALAGVIRISPFNQNRSTWRIDQIGIRPGQGHLDVGTQLIRYCLEHIFEARTWLVEVEVNHPQDLSLYRHNGFQPLAQLTYWELSPQSLATVAEREPTLPNLLPVSNADASLLYQLDTAAMPPLVRQVFDRHIQDFKRNLFTVCLQGLRQWMQPYEQVNGYVFEPQRKAAIGHYEVKLCQTGSHPHQAHLTVHPAYTWLYPELLAHMGRLAQALPAASMYLTSADYQPEREAYLQQIGAERVGHSLMMSRSVWHKLRETRSHALDTLQLPEMLQGLQPNRTPVPGRMSLLPPQWPQTEGAAPTSALPRIAWSHEVPRGASEALVPKEVLKPECRESEESEA